MRLTVSHLSQIGSTYYLRVSIPPELRQALGRREIKKSLGTADIHRASRLAKAMGGDIRALLCTLREVPPAMADQQQVREFIEKVVRDRFRADMHWYEEFRATREPLLPGHAQQELEDAEKRLERLKGELVRKDTLEHMRPVIASFVSTHYGDEGAAVTKDPTVLDRLCREIQKARITEAQIELERSRGNYDNPYDKFSDRLISDQPASLSPPQPPSAKHTVGALRDRFLKDGETNHGWGAKTKVNVQAVFELFVEVCGEGADIQGFTHQKLLDFRDDVLTKMPPNRGKVARYRGKRYDEILAMKGVVPMSPATVRKYLTWLSTFFKWSTKHDYVVKNPAEGLIPAKPKHSPSDERDPFSQAELAKMIAALAPLRQGQPARPERFWIPLIGIYSGMRLNEICQLYCDDVKQVQGIWCLDINQKTKDKMLKSEAAVRTVPVHPKLIELGLLDHVKAMRSKGEKRLWPNLKHRRDGYGQDFSRWFGVFNDRNVANDPKKVFHSFRHNFTDTLKQSGVQEVAIAELVGHENPSITTGRYGKRLQPKPLLDVLEKLDYGIDLSPLTGE